MKIKCLDEETCNYTHYLKDEEYDYYDLNNKFIKCPSCFDSVAILVPDDFSFDYDIPTYLETALKINYDTD